VNPDKAIDRILELSAKAQTKRREAAENSHTFHKLTGAVLAYGEALNLLTKLRKELQLETKKLGNPGGCRSAIPLSLQVHKYYAPD
jgi:hypothetical protein